MGFGVWGLGFKPGMAVSKPGADVSCAPGAENGVNSRDWKDHRDTVSVSGCSKPQRTCRAPSSIMTPLEGKASHKARGATRAETKPAFIDRPHQSSERLATWPMTEARYLSDRGSHPCRSPMSKFSSKHAQTNPPNACGRRTRRRQGVIEP